MGLDSCQLQVHHELLRRRPAALQNKGDYAAAAVGQILFRDLIVLVAGKTGEGDALHLRAVLQEFGDRLAVFAVPRHADMKGLQAQVQKKGVLRGLDASEVAHQLRRRLGDEGASLPELLRVSDPVIGIIRRAESRVLVRVGHPVELSGIHDGAAHCRAVAVHVLGGGVGDDIRAPLDGTAVHRRREGVVHHQRNAVGMGHLRELLDVKDRQGRVGDGLAEHGSGILLKRRVQLLLGSIRRHEGHVDPHLLHGHGDQVEGPAVDGGACYDVASRLADIEQREEVRRLPGGGQHRRRAAFQRRDLCRHIVVGGILQSCIEISGSFQVEQFSHILAGIIFERG